MYPGGVTAVDQLDLTVCGGVRSSACSAPTAPARPPPPACSPPGCVPTSGRAFVGGVDVVAAPRPGQAAHRRGAPDQHPRPLPHRAGRTSTSTVGSSGWRPRPVAGRGRPTARAVPPRRAGRGTGAGPLRRHGPAAHGGPGRDAPARPSSSSTSPPPGSTRRAASPSGRSSASCTTTGRRSSSPPTTWKRPTSSATGWPSSTTAVLALDTPDRPEGVHRCRHHRHHHGRSDGRAGIAAVRRPAPAPTSRAPPTADARRRRDHASACTGSHGVLPAVVADGRGAPAYVVHRPVASRAHASRPSSSR